MQFSVVKKMFYTIILSFIVLNNNCFVQENKQVFLYTEEGLFGQQFEFSFYDGNGYLEICIMSLANYWIDPSYEEDIFQTFQGNYIETKQGPFSIINLDNKLILYLPSKDGKFAFLIPLKDAGEGKWPLFSGVSKGLYDSGYFIVPSVVKKISSYLTEKTGDITFTYNPSAFPNGIIRHGPMWTGQYERAGTIWATDGYGIGESITIKSYLGSSGIILQNGFVAPWNLDLYYQNSRVKKILVEYNGFSEIEKIADTPNPQIIDLKRDDVEEVTITILEVYPGTKYKDTAISSILFLRKRDMLNGTQK